MRADLYQSNDRRQKKNPQAKDLSESSDSRTLFQLGNFDAALVVSAHTILAAKAVAIIAP